MRRFLLLLLIVFYNFSYSQTNPNVDCILQFQTYKKLIELKNLISESFQLTINWVFIERKESTPYKLRFIDIKERDFKKITDTLSILASKQSLSFQNKISSVIINSLDLLEKEYVITQNFLVFENYDNAMLVFEILPELEYRGSIPIMNKSILDEIELIIYEVNQNIENCISFNVSKNYKSPKLCDIERLIKILKVEEQIERTVKIKSKESVAQFKESLVKSYDKNFTHNEIKDLIDFYTSHTGQKLIKKSPYLILELLIDLQNKRKEP